MKQYDTYQDSGIAWIGEIPSEWEVCRIKNISIISSGDIISKEEYMDNGQYPIIGSNGEIGRINKINNNKNVLTTGRVGSIGTVQLVKDSWITDNALIINITSDDNIRYIYYALPLLDYQLISTGTAQPLISASALKTQSLPLPSVKEQQSIASFLDTKCGEIDALISLQEEMISELQAYKQSVITEAVTKGLNPHAKMKDSGVEWIGEIPEGWNLKRIKFVADVWGRIGFRGYKSEDLNKDGIGAITLSPSNMKTIKMDYSQVTYLSWEKYNESPEIMIRNGDILFVKTGSSYGKACYVEDLPREATINPQILRIVPLINSKFLCYFMQTSSIRYETECGVVGGTIPTISQEKINNMFVACPSNSQQLEIVKYLDEKTSQIDSLISLKQEKIEELKDYKKSIIYEYVTGKKRV